MSASGDTRLRATARDARTRARTDHLHDARRERERRLEALHAAAYGWAITCCQGDEPEAEDVVQEAYLRLLSGRARFEGRSELRTFVFGVVKRVAGERARRRERRGLLLRLEHAETPGATTTHTVERSEEAARVRAALSELSPRQAQLLHLVFYEELTIEAAAEVLDVSLGTARTHYERGKARMREALGTAACDGRPRGALA